MGNRVIDATLRFVDKFTAPMANTVNRIEKSSKSIQRAGKEIQKTGEHISKTGANMTAKITTPIVAAGVAAFEMASDLNENMNKVDVAFGKSAASVKKWSKSTLDNFGLSQNTALETASLYGDMATGMGINAKKAAEMSKKLTGLSADLSSFKNVSQGVSKDALKGIFTGEGESLKSLGVIMNDTTLQAYAVSHGFLKSTVSAVKMKEMSIKVALAQSDLAKKIKKYGVNSDEAKKSQLSLNKALENQAKSAKGSYANLSQAEKVQLRYKFVLDATKNSQGDFARTSSGAANQQRIFTEGVKELATNFGQKLYPAGTKIITTVNGLVKKFSSLSDKQQDSVLKFLGLAAAIGPGIFLFGKLTTGVGAATVKMGNFGVKVLSSARAFDKMKNVGAIGTGFSKFGNIGKAAFMAISSPAGIAVIAIAAIALAAFLIIKNWSKVKAFLGKLGNYIKSIFKACGGDTEKLGAAFKKVKNVISIAVKAIPPIINTILKVLKVVGRYMAVNFVNQMKIGLAIAVGIFAGVFHSFSGIMTGIQKIFTGIVTFIKGVFTGNWKQAWEGVKTIFGGVFQSFKSLATLPLNAVIGLLNGAIAGINKLDIKIPKWVPVLGGKNFSINVPKIPFLAKGTNNWQGGLAVTQDKGGEIMDLPKTTRVYPHDKSIAMARAEGKRRGTKSVILNKIADTIIVRNDSDIEAITDAVINKIIKVIDNGGGEVFA
ncbi:phage tail tape measure protein [Anaerocolumna chitinilytica]|uniref:Phage tail tape measure protein n=1 Tax=Anaerocolumna chitinilytica TaxID=1727145 RepID=A0A7M3S9Z0_9FIRM|nr:hypothetical protein [Anaerocolumna chitinilytica]BCK01408.1 hypothetical protein bsdcttw_44480 [Anaerocolumna chitinilytica]